jgi:hypothetical protein
MTKWQKTAEHGADEIREALEEALALLEDPAEAYLRATPDTRRLFNQALFEKLIIHEIGPVTGQATRWVSAFESVARIKTRQIYGRPKPGDSTSGKNEPATSDEKVTGSNDFKLVRPEGFEPPTFCSEDRRSNPLSYGRIKGVYYSNRVVMLDKLNITSIL